MKAEYKNDTMKIGENVFMRVPRLRASPRHGGLEGFSFRPFIRFLSKN